MFLLNLIFPALNIDIPSFADPRLCFSCFYARRSTTTANWVQNTYSTQNPGPGSRADASLQRPVGTSAEFRLRGKENRYRNQTQKRSLQCRLSCLPGCCRPRQADCLPFLRATGPGQARDYTASRIRRNREIIREPATAKPVTICMAMELAIF